MVQNQTQKVTPVSLSKTFSFGFHLDLVLKESVIRDIWSGQEANSLSGRNSRAPIEVGNRVK